MSKEREKWFINANALIELDTRFNWSYFSFDGHKLWQQSSPHQQSVIKGREEVRFLFRGV